MPFCIICLETIKEADPAAELDHVCPRCCDQQIPDLEDTALFGDLDSELAAIRREYFVRDDEEEDSEW